MSRKIFAFALPLICSLASASSFAGTISIGHFNFVEPPPIPVMTATVPAIIGTPILWSQQSITGTITIQTVQQTWTAPSFVIEATTFYPAYYSGSGTLTVSGSLVNEVSEVPLAGGGLYFMGALLPLVARWLKRRR